MDILAFRNRVIPERLFIYLFIYFTWLFEHQKLLIGQVFVVDFVFLLSIQLILLSNGERVSVSVEPWLQVHLVINIPNYNSSSIDWSKRVT